MSNIRDVWVYLAASPLLHLVITLVAFQAAARIYERAGRNPLFNPIVIAIALIVPLLFATGTSYQTYFQGAQFVHFLLGPATVALAVPLYRQFDKVRRSAFGIFVSLLVGSLTAAVSAVVIVALLGGNREAMISVVPKSVTAPVAMGITEKLGGLPSLTAVLVILTGIIGASLGPPLMNALGIKAWEARGFAIGVASHGIGTARALEVNELAGAFSGLAMGLNAMLASVILPLLWRVFT